MKLGSPHKDWKLDVLAVPDARAVGVDQLLTQLWLRIANDNRQTTTAQEPRTRVAELASKIEGARPNQGFAGFDPGDGVAEAWLRADLLKVFKRNPDIFAVARPLHLQATLLRNPARDSDSEASGIVYGWLTQHPDVLTILRQWLEVSTEDPVRGFDDLPSYALARLAEDVEPETRKGDPRAGVAPVYPRQGTLYAEDLRRLLAYRGQLPRPVLIDHIGRLTMLHLGLYLLHTYDLVVSVNAGSGADRPSLELCVDCGEDARSGPARLAESSWSSQEETLAQYVRAHLRLKKLQELAPELSRKPPPTDTLEDIASIPARVRKSALDDHARPRIADLVSRAAAGEERSQLEEARDEFRDLGLNDFDTYMAMLYQLSERRWFNYLRYLLDSLFLKNETGGLLRQPIGGRRVRRFVLSPGLLGTLSLIAMVTETARGLETRPLRLDQLIERLDKRYDMLVARPPARLSEDPAAVAAMLENQRLLRRRLRESGLFLDLSDAFLSQLLRPRVEVRQ